MILAVSVDGALRHPALDVIGHPHAVHRPIPVDGLVAVDVLEEPVAEIAVAGLHAPRPHPLVLRTVDLLPARDDPRARRHAAFPGLLAHRAPGLDGDVPLPLEAGDGERLLAAPQAEIRRQHDEGHQREEDAQKPWSEPA